MHSVTTVYKAFFIITAYCYAVDGANILAIFVCPSYSHQMPLLRLSRALAARGHNLTVITANPSEEPITNHTEIDISFCYEMLRKGQLGISLDTKINIFKIFKDNVKFMVKLTDVQMKSRQVQHFLSWAKDVKFDLVLYEQLWLFPYLAMVHTLGSPPVVGISTIEMTSLFSYSYGSPLNLAYVPMPQPFSDHMSFYERLLNVLIYFWYIYLREWYLYPEQDKIIKEVFGDGMPSARELEMNKSLLMFSGDGSLAYPQAMTPNIVQLGPLHIVKPKPLPADLEKWMSGAEDGVIYFSLGSNMQGTSLPDESREAFLSVFERFPAHRVVWKWESDTYFPGQPTNVMFRKWTPQQDLLGLYTVMTRNDTAMLSQKHSYNPAYLVHIAHPKLKLFITQGGLQSLQETIHNAVPVVCIPLFGDQEMHCRKVAYAEIGQSLDFFHLTSDSVFKAVNDVLQIPKYKNNIKHMSDISKDRVLSPVDQGIWWIEYVLRHNGATHLRPATLDMNWSQYFLLDVATFLVAVLCVTVFVIFKLGKLLYKMYRTRFCTSKLKQN